MRQAIDAFFESPVDVIRREFVPFYFSAIRAKDTAVFGAGYTTCYSDSRVAIAASDESELALPFREIRVLQAIEV